MQNGVYIAIDCTLTRRETWETERARVEVRVRMRRWEGNLCNYAQFKTPIQKANLNIRVHSPTPTGTIANVIFYIYFYAHWHTNMERRMTTMSEIKRMGKRWDTQVVQRTRSFLFCSLSLSHSPTSYTTGWWLWYATHNSTTAFNESDQNINFSFQRAFTQLFLFPSKFLLFIIMIIIIKIECILLFWVNPVV